MQVINRYVDGEAFMWRRGDGAEQVIHFTFEGRDLCKPVPAKNLAVGIQEINEASVSWTEVCFVQLMCVGGSDAREVVTVVPNVPCVGAMRHRKIVSSKGPVEQDDVELTRREVAPHLVVRNERLNIKDWLPATKVNGPIAKTPLERPSEGTITRALPNGKVSLVKIVEQVASKKPVSMKSGSFGGISGVEVEVGSFAKTRAVSDDEEADWPGQTDRRRAKTAIQGCLGRRAVGVSPPNKNRVPTEGAISAPDDVHSIGISFHKLPEPEEYSFADGDEEAQFLIDWRRGLVNAAPDGGDCLDHRVTAPEGKFPRDITKEEIQEKWQEVRKAKVKELNCFYDLGCFQFCFRRKFDDIIDARWVTIWKMIGGNVGVKCRFAARGFKDMFQDFDRYAATVSRSGQRFVNVVAAGDEDSILFSFDVSRALVKGLTFKEFSELIGRACRAVQSDVLGQYVEF